MTSQWHSFNSSSIFLWTSRRGGSLFITQDLLSNKFYVYWRLSDIEDLLERNAFQKFCLKDPGLVHYLQQKSCKLHTFPLSLAFMLCCQKIDSKEKLGSCPKNVKTVLGSSQLETPPLQILKTKLFHLVFIPSKQTSNIPLMSPMLTFYLAKLWSFTNLDFPEIRGCPFLSYLLEGPGIV